MRIRTSVALALLAAGLYLSSSSALAAPQSQSPTASTAGNSATDRDAMQKIRKAVMADKQLSGYAKNVKIVAQNGKVTLRGPVRSEEEKKTVAEMASSVVGADNVTNQITIQPGK